MAKEHFYLFAHLVGVFILVGAAGFSTAAGIITSRTNNLRLQVVLLDLQRKTELIFTSLGALITIVFGMLLVSPTGNEMGDAWVSTAFLLIIIVLGVDHGVLMPANRKARARADELLRQGAEESPEPAAIVGAPLKIAAGIGMDLSFIVFLWLMIYRPGS